LPISYPVHQPPRSRFPSYILDRPLTSIASLVDLGLLGGLAAGDLVIFGLALGALEHRGLGLGLLLLAHQARQVGGGLLGLVDAGLGLGSGLAEGGAEDAANGVGVAAEECLGVNGVFAKVNELRTMLAGVCFTRRDR
jgi:hypothetical protein